MNTKQVEEKTGISRQNIRFYEKMGLIHPARNEENSYRDYSKEDVNRLEYIKLFRMLSIPIEEIAKIFSDEVNMETVLKMQRENLIEKQREMQGAIRICEQMEKEVLSGKQISATEYLGRIEYEQHTKGGFGGFKEDYQKLVAAEGIRQYSFVTDEDIRSIENLSEVVCDSLGEAWSVTKEKDQFVAHHGSLVYQVSQKKMKSNNKKHYMSTLVILSLEDPEEVVMPENRKMFLYTLHSVGKNIKTHKWRSILSVLFSLFIILLLAAYTGSIQNVKEQQEVLPKRTTIKGTVYNQNGTLDDGILIQDKYADAIAKSKYITKYMEKASLVAVLSNEGCGLSGMNETFMQEKMTDANVEWTDTYNFQIFDQSRDGCMMNQDFMNNHGLKIGDVISVDTSYYKVDPGTKALILLPLTSVNLEIVGTYQITERSADELESVDPILVPLDTVKKWYSDEQKRYYANAISFYVKNPKDLNSLKQELKDADLGEVKTEQESDYSGSAILLNDRQYIETAERLKRSENLLQSFVLLIFVLIVLIGIIVAYLITQSRRNEVMIMRMLGVKRKNIVSSYGIEQMSLFLLGLIAAFIVVCIIKVPISILFLQMILLFFISYVIGVFTAVGQMIPNRNVRMDHA